MWATLKEWMENLDKSKLNGPGGGGGVGGRDIEPHPHKFWRDAYNEIFFAGTWRLW